MNTINKLLLVIPLFAFMFSCSDYFPENQKVLDSSKIIGKTFSTEVLSLTFVSKDSVSFNTKNILYLLEGKSKYELHNDTIIIKSPYGKRLEPSEATESYIYNFIGCIKNDRIDKASFFIIGPEEKEQIVGIEITLFME